MGTRPELDIPMPGRSQAHLMLIFKTAPNTSPDTPALDLLETSLGGMGGPLFRDLRDKQGLGYTVTAFNRQTSENGYMVFYIGTEPGKMAQAEEGSGGSSTICTRISCRKRMLTGERTSLKATITGTCKASAAVRVRPRP